MWEHMKSQEQLNEEINLSAFILEENGYEEWKIDENQALERQAMIARVNALNSIGRSLITLNRLILQGYTRS